MNFYKNRILELCIQIFLLMNSMIILMNFSYFLWEIKNYLNLIQRKKILVVKIVLSKGIVLKVNKIQFNI